MSNWSSYAWGSGSGSCALGNCRRRSAAALGVLLGSCVALAAGDGLAAPDGTSMDRPAREGSVLVATRKASDSAPAEHRAERLLGEEGLEPIADVTEHVPDVAVSDEDEKAAASFGAALSEAVSRPAASPPAKTQAAGKDAGIRPKAGDERLSAPMVARRSNSAAAISAKLGAAFEPSKFNGILVGKSTQTELVAAWGEPAESISTSDGAVLTYYTEPFESVDVLISTNELVAAIKISLTAALEPKQLVRQLALEKFDPVTVSDEAGTPLGMAFPERGVLFMFSAADHGLTTIASAYEPLVSHVAIQPLDSRAFALRAEQRLHGPYTQNIDDLKTAVALEPDFAEAHWMLAEIYLATGQADLAEAAAAAAVDLQPRNPLYRLRHAHTLELLAQYDDAVHEVRAVLDSGDIAPLVKAQALHQMAQLASLGDAQIASKAISFDTKAIEIADLLATSDDAQERRAAKRLLIEAHLAIGAEVARQSFSDKLESISQWIGRASGIAEEYISQDGGGLELRLLVAQKALAAMASFKPAVDPTPWVAEAEEAARALARQSDDELWQQRLKWELGVVYLNALRVEHLRRETTAALRYGKQAVECLAEGAASRQAVHTSEQLVGQLYFQIGAVHAVHRQDHIEAAEWYDKAAPLVTSPRPVSELYSPRREGEVLVSMGVTYWQIGRQSRAVEITRAGADLVELAVEDGILARSSLAVPYGNLATMYQHLGETTSAAKYAELAKNVEPAKGASAAQAGRAVAGAAGGQAIQANAQSQTRRMNGTQR